VVTGLHPRHARAYRLDDPGTFVTCNDRFPTDQDAVDQVQVGVAESGSDELEVDFTEAGLGDVQGAQLELGAVLFDDRCECFHSGDSFTRPLWVSCNDDENCFWPRYADLPNQ
jgi:hypothetical protein